MRGDFMTQRAEHSYHTEDNVNYGRNVGSSNWIWGVMAALAALAVIAWFATSGGPISSLNVSDQSAPAVTQGTTTGSTEPAQPVAPAPAQQPAQPAQ
jgi:hypothetical protein